MERVIIRLIQQLHLNLLSKAADRIAAAAAAGGGVGWCGEGGDWARLRRDLVLKESGRKEEVEEEVEKDRVAGRPELNDT